MFESGGSQEVPEAEAFGVLTGVPEVEWTAALREHHAVIARAQFLEIDAIATVYLNRCADDARRGVNEAFQGEFANAEVGLVYRWTEPTAQRAIGLGLDLRWRLHATSAAFASGTIDHARAQIISDVLANVTAERVEFIEQLLLDGSGHLNTTKLRAKARQLIARHDPEGVKARRESAEAGRDVRFRANDDGTSSIEGSLPGPGAQIVAMRLRRMCFDVCGRDPRTFAQRRADALIALAAGHPRLACQCGQRDCTATAEATASAPNTAAAVPTGDAARESRTESHAADSANNDMSVGPSDVGTRDVAAQPWTAGECHCGSSEAATTPAGPPEMAVQNAAASATTVSRPEARSASLPALPQATIHVGVNVTTLLGLDDLPGYLAGHGPIDADLAREIASDGTWRRVLTLTERDRTALLDALCGHTGTRTPRIAVMATDGSTHLTSDAGTGAAPPGMNSDEQWLARRSTTARAPGTVLDVGRALRAAGVTPTAIRERTATRRDQLTYRPSTTLAATVQTRDGTCRFPGCSVRAANCDLDHTIPFDHEHPEHGGLTVEQNLACLCRRHHRLKTGGTWTVRQIGSGRLEWRSPTGEFITTEPGGTFADAQSDVAVAAAHGLTLTDTVTLDQLFGPHRGRGVEDDLRYLISAHPKQNAVVSGTPANSANGNSAHRDEPPPF